MQEDKELSFDAMDTVKGCVALFNGMLATMRFNKEMCIRDRVWDFVFIHIQVMEISRLITRAIPIVRAQGKW